MATEKVKLLRSVWTVDMRADLSHIEADCEVDWYEKEVRGGRLAAFSVFADLMRVATVLVRREEDELVLVAGAGRADFDLCAATFPLLEAMAIGLGCSSMRLHTRRGGMIEKASRQGWDLTEYVMRKAV